MGGQVCSAQAVQRRRHDRFNYKEDHWEIVQPQLLQVPNIRPDRGGGKQNCGNISSTCWNWTCKLLVKCVYFFFKRLGCAIEGETEKHEEKESTWCDRNGFCEQQEDNSDYLSHLNRSGSDRYP